MYITSEITDGVEIDKNYSYQLKIKDRTNKLKHIIPAIDQWAIANIEYMKVFKESDCIFWHTERANIGALAAGVWKAGGVAIEEFAHNRKDDQKKRRVDLFFKMYDDDYSYFVEAKKDNVRYENTESTVKTLIENAVSQIKNYEIDSEGWKKLAICFVSPYYRTKDKAMQLKNDLENFNSLSKTNDFDFLALLQTSDNYADGNYYFNSVILAGKIVE